MENNLLPKHIVHQNGFDQLVLKAGATGENIDAAMKDHYDVLFLSDGDWPDLAPFQVCAHRVRRIWVKTYGHFQVSGLGLFDRIIWLKMDFVEPAIKKEALDFSRFAKLEECWLYWADYCSDAIFDLPELRILTLVCYNGHDFSSVGRLKSLLSLSMEGGSLKSLRGLENHVALSSLELARMRGLTDISALATLSSKLQILNIKGCPKLVDLTVLQHLVSLQELSIDGKNLDFECIRNLSLLTSLFVDNPHQFDVRLLFALPSLTKVQMIRAGEFLYSQEELHILAAQQGCSVKAEIMGKGKSRYVQLDIVSEHT